MEHIERTEVAGNTININKQENKVEEQVEQEIETNIAVIPVNIPINDLINTMIKDGKLINWVIQDSEFDTAVESILSDKADDAISEYISDNASSIANELDSEIRDIVGDSLDYSDIANNVEYEIDWTDRVTREVESMMQSFEAGSDCSTAKAAASIIIDTIRYDLIKHLRAEQGATSVYEATITDSLTKFIDERIEERLEQEKRLYLENKQAYMADVKPNEAYITASSFGQFVNKLALSDSMKQYIIDEFMNATVNYNK